MEHFKVILSVGVVCLVISLSGISYSADIPAIRDAKDPAERARVQALIDGARKEGKLEWPRANIYPEQAEQIIAGFKEYYGLPQLEFINTYTVGAELITRVEQLFNAGRTPPDVILSVAWDWFTALMKRGKLMRYDSPYYKEYTISHRTGLSRPGYWVSDAYASGPVWNVTALEKRGIKNFNPTSWWDFIDPKLIPLICMSNLYTSISGIPWGIGMRKTVGDDWFIKLGKGKPSLYMKALQAEGWVASGEYPIGLTIRPPLNGPALEAGGAKIQWLYPKEGLVLFPLTLVILSDAPHPNTAKLLVDYVRSAPGVDRVAEATVYSNIWGRPDVKVPEKYRKYQAPTDVKIIPIDWDKEVTIEAVNSFKAWAKKIGVGY